MVRDHEEVVFGPQVLTRIPPRHYCIIKNPAVRVEKEPVLNDFGEVTVQFGEMEVRTHEEWSDPFPLEPYEEIEVVVTPYRTINKESALRLECTRPFTEEDETL